MEEISCNVRYIVEEVGFIISQKIREETVTIVGAIRDFSYFQTEIW